MTLSEIAPGTTLVATAALTLFFAAIIWYTQILGYPLWRHVGKGEFLALHQDYLRRLPLIVQIPYGLLMLSSSLFLFVHPYFVTTGVAAVVWALHFAILPLSAGLAGPIHGQFYTEGHCAPEKLRRLVTINAVRTLVMAASSAIMIALLLQPFVIGSAPGHSGAGNGRIEINRLR